MYRTKTTYKVVELTTVEAHKGFSLPDGFSIVGFVKSFRRGRWFIVQFLAVRHETVWLYGNKVKAPKITRGPKA